MTHLKPGEVGILQFMPEEFAKLEHEEATVKRLCQKGDTFTMNGFRGYAPCDGYVVDVRSFGITYVRHDQLRRQADPGEVDAAVTDLFKRLTKPSQVVA